MSTSTTTASNVSPPKPASTPSSSTSAQVTIPEIPDGYTIFTENTASILLPSTDEAFLNPVQEFNRDMSVACIRVWSDELNQAKEERWKRVNEGGVKVKGKGKKKRGKAEEAEEDEEEVQPSPRKKARKGVPPPPEIDDEEFEKLQQKLFGDKSKPTSKSEAAAPSTTKGKRGAKGRKAK